MIGNAKHEDAAPRSSRVAAILRRDVGLNAEMDSPMNAADLASALEAGLSSQLSHEGCCLIMAAAIRTDTTVRMSAVRLTRNTWAYVRYVQASSAASGKLPQGVTARQRAALCADV